MALISFIISNVFKYYTYSKDIREASSLGFGIGSIFHIIMLAWHQYTGNTYDLKPVTLKKCGNYCGYIKLQLFIGAIIMLIICGYINYLNQIWQHTYFGKWFEFIAVVSTAFLCFFAGHNITYILTSFITCSVGIPCIIIFLICWTKLLRVF